MATNSCLKYSFCVEWTTKMPFQNIPRRSPNIILLEGIECNLELTTSNDIYNLNIVFQKSKGPKVLNKLTLTTFIRNSTHGEKELPFCLLKPFENRHPVRVSEILWTKSKGEILKEVPHIFNIGQLTIVCVFHSTDTHLDKDPSALVSRRSLMHSDHLNSLAFDFSTLQQDETFSNLKLKCAGWTYSANRSVLAARSHVFAAMFQNKRAEMEAGEIDIKDTDPETLEFLLKYLYSAEIPDLCEETARRLYEAADKYAVHGLRLACSDWMVERLTTENCLDLLLFGDKHSDENFKEAVACFVAEHLRALSAESWSTFRKNYPQLVISVLEKRCAD